MASVRLAALASLGDEHLSEQLAMLDDPVDKVFAKAVEGLDTVSYTHLLAAICGGGTSCSAPLKQLADAKAKVDTLILVSDNESWIDARRHGATETLRQWERIKQFNPQARLICIDLQPHGTTQAPDRADILNVGGFSDAVFDVVAQFASGTFGAGHWVDAIEQMEI